MSYSLSSNALRGEELRVAATIITDIIIIIITSIIICKYYMPLQALDFVNLFCSLLSFGQLHL